MRIDCHVHSDASRDGRSTLDALAAAAAQQGLDALVIADHDHYTLSEPQQRSGVWLLPGIECSTDAGHILGLLPDTTPVLPPWSPLPKAETVVAELRRCGAVTVLAHPFHRPGATPRVCTDAIESVNARAYFKNPTANPLAAALAQELALPVTGGSDAHSVAELGNAYTELELTELTPEAVKAALRAGLSRPVLVRNTPRRLKGRSQLCKARRSGSLRRRVKSLIYYFYCVWLDLTKGTRTP